MSRRAHATYKRQSAGTDLTCKSLKRHEQLQFTDSRQPETTHHIRVVRGSDSLVIKVVPVDWREKGVVLYF